RPVPEGRRSPSVRRHGELPRPLHVNVQPRPRVLLYSAGVYVRRDAKVYGRFPGVADRIRHGPVLGTGDQGRVGPGQ
nr:hypothetical protein [Tanacetum cinerariifolium]